MQADPQLSELYKQNKSQNDFGNLCALYVGMTRAKRGLYMLSDFDRVSAGSTVHYLRDRLGTHAIEEGCSSVAELGEALKCGTNCGSCKPALSQLIDKHLVIEIQSV